MSQRRARPGISVLLAILSVVAAILSACSSVATYPPVAPTATTTTMPSTAMLGARLKWSVTVTAELPVNVRDKPSVMGAVVRTLAPNEKIESGDHTIPGFDGGPPWVAVAWDEEHGYVRSDFVTAPQSETITVDLTPPTPVATTDLTTRIQDLKDFVHDGSCTDLPSAWCPRLQGVGFAPTTGGYTIYATTTLTTGAGDARQVSGVCDALWQYATNWDQHGDIRAVEVRNAQGTAIATGVVGGKRC